MSFQTKHFGVSINKDQLLNLLLGQGDLLIQLYGQKPITLKEFFDQHVLKEEAVATSHKAKIRGISEDSNLSHIDGKVIMTPIQDNTVFMCTLTLHLHNHFD